MPNSDTFVAALRCQTWHVWPEKTVIEASSFTLDIGSGALIPAQLAVISYQNRAEPAEYSSENTEIGPLMWTGIVPGLYLVRDAVLKAPEDTIEMVWEHQHPRRGEIDLSIAFRYSGELPASAVEALRCTLFATMSLVNLQLGDFLTPVAPMQIRKVDSHDSQIASDVLLAVRNRRHLQENDLDPVINKIATALSSTPNTEKLRTALELYGSHFFERQARTRFLLLVIALETLAIPTLKHQVALDLLERWKMALLVEQARHAETGPEYASLEALSLEILRRREDSIRNQIRTLIRRAAQTKSDDPIPFERRALHVYDTRSALVHDGSLIPGVLDKAETDAREILEYVLRSYVA